MDEIRFYGPEFEYGWMSNFSTHGFMLGGKWWQTAEHFYQAMKFLDPVKQDEVRAAGGPGKAKRMGRQVGLRPDWDDVKDQVMRVALRAKFCAHKGLQTLLRATDEACLIENAPRDYYWGCGAAGTGLNRLGELLMELRADMKLGLKMPDISEVPVMQLPPEEGPGIFDVFEEHDGCCHADILVRSIPHEFHECTLPEGHHGPHKDATGIWTDDTTVD